jgi:hypothetical protein
MFPKAYFFVIRETEAIGLAILTRSEITGGTIKGKCVCSVLETQPAIKPDTDENTLPTSKVLNPHLTANGSNSLFDGLIL